MEGPSPRSLASLVRSIAILALPAQDQAAWVESLGVGPVVDELALELGDRALLAQQFVDAGWLGAAVLSPLRALDALLKDMSGPENASLWHTSALDSSPQWAEARNRAKAVLGAIDGDRRPSARTRHGRALRSDSGMSGLARYALSAADQGGSIPNQSGVIGD